VAAAKVIVVNQRIHPDVFIVAQIDLDLVSSLSAFRAMRGRRQNP
jgi:hypothetical protein